MKIIRFILNLPLLEIIIYVGFICLAALLCSYTNDQPNKLKTVQKTLPNIAIDIEKEYKQDYMRLLWEINTKEHTK